MPDLFFDADGKLGELVLHGTCPGVTCPPWHLSYWHLSGGNLSANPIVKLFDLKATKQTSWLHPLLILQDQLACDLIDKLLILDPSKR